MAKSKAKLASTKTVSTKWLQNAMRSIGVSTKNVLKNDFAPNLYEAVEAGANTSKTIINSIRRNANGTNQVSNHLQNNKYVKFAQTAYKNALSDLKSGNLNNEDRFGDSLFGDSGNLESALEDSGFSFDDDGVDSMNVNIVNASGNNDAMFAMTTHLQKQTEATLKTNQANMNAMIAMNSASMMQTQQVGSLLVAGLDAINKNLSSIIEYNNTNMNKFIESSLAFYERMGSTFDKENSSTTPGKIQGHQVLNNATGGINFSQYKQYIKQQFKDTLKGSNAGMIAGMIDDQMLQMAASNPLGFATEGLIKFMIPKMVTNTIKGVEETFSAFMPSLLHKLASWGEGSADGLLGRAKQFIGKTFGLKIERTEKIDKAQAISKGPIPFDGQTKHAITEIITKELREQTSYLKAIAEHYKIDTKSAKNNAEVFDYRTGKYIKASQTTENIYTEIANSVINTMSNSRFGKSLSQYGKNYTDDKAKDAYNDLLGDLFLKLEKFGDSIDLSDKTLNDKNSNISKIIDELSGSKKLKKDLISNLLDMAANKPIDTMDLSSAMLRARSSRNSTIKDIQSNPTEYNLFAAGDLDNIDEGIAQMRANQRSNQRISIKKNKPSDQINSETETLFGKLSGRTSQGLGQMALGLLNGSSDQVVSEFTSMMGDQIKTLWSKFDETFLSPIKTQFIGTKDEKGFSQNGILSGLINSFKDASGILKHHITGKSFTDSKGNVYDDKDDNTVVGNLKKIGTTIKESVIAKLFGEKSIDEKGNITKEKSGGILSGFTNSIKEGLVGWQEALFGKKLDENEKKNLKDSMVKNLNERMPNTVTGTTIGAGVGMLSGGGLLGTLIGGPIGGAAMGTALGFLSKSEKFQGWLFGEKDENGERTGGVISKKVQDYFKKNKKTAIGGAAVGAVTGAFTGGGILGTLLGGPIGGALVGMGTSLLAKSEMFKEFLYGDEKTGQQGVIDKLKKVFGGGQKDKSDKSDGGKAFGMGALGAGAGALTAAIVGKMGILGAALTPFGPIGGALVGLGLSIRAQKDTFKKWLFGEKDEKGNKKKEGILGQFANMLKVSLFSPLKNRLSEFAEDAKITLKYEILDRIRFAIEPIGNAVKGLIDPIKEKVSGLFTKISDKVGDIFKNKIIEKIDDFLVTPLRKAVTGLMKLTWGMTKKMVTAPFKLISAIGKALNIKKKLDDYLFNPIKNLVKTVIVNPVKKLFGGLWKGLGFATKFLIKKPLEFIGGVSNHLSNKIAGVGKPDKEAKEAGGIIENESEEKRLNRENYKIAKDNARKHRAENKIHEKNAREIARITGYQLAEDTEENRQKALALAKAQGKKIKINEDISALAKAGSTDGMNANQIAGADVTKLSEEGRQTHFLVKIYDLLHGKLPDKDKDGNENSDDNKDENNKSDETSTSTSGKNTPEESGAERIAREIDESGGIGNYISRKFNSAKDSIKHTFSKNTIKDEFNNSWMGEKVKNITGLLGRFKGKGHAKGTNDTGDESAVIGENGPELVNFSKGNQVFANTKPLQVVLVGMGKKLKSLFTGNFGKYESDGVNADSADARSIAAKIANVGGDASSIIAGIHGAGKDEANQEALEDSMNATARMLTAKSSKDKALDDAKTAEEIKKDKEAKEQKKSLENISKNTKEQAEGQKKYTSLWSSIFSKKGLITGGLLLAVPLIIKHFPKIIELLKNVASTIGAGASDLIGDISWTNKHNARTDGNTIGEEIQNTVNEIKNGNILTDDDGNVTARTNSGATFIGRRLLNFKFRNNKLITDGKLGKTEKAIYRGAEKGVKGIKPIVSKGAKFAKTGITKITGGKAYSVDDVAKKFGTSADDVMATFAKNKNGKITTKTIAKTMGTKYDDVSKLMKSSGSDIAENIVKNKADDAVTKTATTMVKNNADDAAKSGVFKKVIGYIGDFFKFLAKKVGSTKIFKEVSESVIGKALQKIWPKTVGKITAKLTAATAAVAASAGLSEVLFTALGALDGATGAAKLFQVPKDKVDGTMITVATIFGGLSGFSYTGVVMLVFDLVGPILGFNILSSLAIAMYNFLVGNDEEKVKNLKDAQSEHHGAYLSEREKTLQKQYETQKKAGIIGEDVTFEMFKAGIEDGTYSADYTSFQDWNARKNASVGDKLISGGAKIIKGTGKALGAAGSFLFGKNIKTYEDDKGTKYYENKDGTYQVINATGADLGYISKEALPAGLEEKKTRKKSIFEKGWDATKSLFVDTKKEAYYATDGTYYDSKGKHYSASGEKIGKVSREELQTLISSGALTKGEMVKDSGFKTLGKTVSGAASKLWGSIKDGWNKFTKGAAKVGSKIKETATKVWNTATTFVKDKVNKVKEFLVGKKTTAWFDSAGCYYRLNGDTYDYYNANGDIISTGTTQEEFITLVQSGVLTEGEITIDSNIKTGIKKIGEGIKDTFNKVKNKAVGAWKKISKTGIKIFENIKKNSLFGSSIDKLFKSTSTQVWYDPNGNYYKLNGDVFDYYNANNDLIEAGISNDTVKEKIIAGLLTSGHITEDSVAKKAVAKIKESVSNAWNKAKDTVSSGWDKFTTWLTGGSGNINNMNTSEYGSPQGLASGSGRIGGRGIPYYSQNDSSWAKNAYGKDGSTMADSGCGPTVMAMIASKFTGKKITPEEMAKLSEFSGTRDSSGTNANFINIAANSYGIPSTQMNGPNANNLYNAAKNGPTVLLGENANGIVNPFTNAGHYVVTDGVDSNGNINIKDPRGSGYNKKYPAENLANTTGSMWGFGINPFGNKGRNKTKGGRGLFDLFDKLGSAFSEIGSRMWTGITTGNWNTDFSTLFNKDSEDSSTTTTFDTSTTKSIGNTSANAASIWKYFKALNLPDNTVAGILANMHAESGFNPQNLQNSYENKLGFNDASYTAAVDNGTYNNFVRDAAGYGLVQWTYHTLKDELLKYARKKGTSVGDMNTQLELLLQQFNGDYKSTWNKMINAKTPEEASTLMLTEFEKPAVLNTAERAGYAKQYYDLYGGKGRGSKPRINKKGASVHAIKSGFGSNTDYVRAANASNYISSTSSNNMTKAINMIISLLESITGNTASTSSKLDMLEKLKNNNVVVGGDTNNYVNNNGSKTSNNTSNNLTGVSRSSRNQSLAEKIAMGV